MDLDGYFDVIRLVSREKYSHCPLRTLEGNGSCFAVTNGLVEFLYQSEMATAVASFSDYRSLLGVQLALLEINIEVSLTYINLVIRGSDEYRG